MIAIFGNILKTLEALQFYFNNQIQLWNSKNYFLTFFHLLYSK